VNPRQPTASNLQFGTLERRRIEVVEYQKSMFSAVEWLLLGSLTYQE
jgi:hypothetical protein